MLIPIILKSHSIRIYVTPSGFHRFLNVSGTRTIRKNMLWSITIKAFYLFTLRKTLDFCFKNLFLEFLPFPESFFLLYLLWNFKAFWFVLDIRASSSLPTSWEVSSSYSFKALKVNRIDNKEGLTFCILIFSNLKDNIQILDNFTIEVPS